MFLILFMCVCRKPTDSGRDGCEHTERGWNEHVSVCEILWNSRGPAWKTLQRHQPGVQSHEAGEHCQAPQCGKRPWGQGVYFQLLPSHRLLCKEQTTSLNKVVWSTCNSVHWVWGSHFYPSRKLVCLTVELNLQGLDTWWALNHAICTDTQFLSRKLNTYLLVFLLQGSLNY